MQSSSNQPHNYIDTILHNFPIFQAVHAVFVICALPVVVILIYLLPKIALHDNCRFLLYFWLSAFLLSIISHGSFIVCDLVSGSDIGRQSYSEIRVIGFAHAFSSVQELIFSIERAFACAHPSTYHDRSFSKFPLTCVELFAAGLACYCSYLLATGKLITACIITNTIDSLSLGCLVVTTLWTDKKRKQILLSHLNEKYQIREAFEITKVMLPCGVISLVMKLGAFSFAWMYGLRIFDTHYALTITSGLYFVIETTNCIICSIVFMRSHSKLRRSLSLMFCQKAIKVLPLSVPIGRNSDLHFESLRKDWR